MDDINRKLAIYSAKYGFAATARRDREHPQVVFEAFTWHNGRIVCHTNWWLEKDFMLMGPVTIVARFIEEARSALPLEEEEEQED